MAQALLAASRPGLSPFASATVPQFQPAKAHPRFYLSADVSGLISSFKTGTSHAFWIASRKREGKCQTRSLSIKCEQGTKENNGLDIWLSRLAMVGFAAAITVEIATGKGLLENFGFATPLPTLALVVTALVGILTAFFIFQSASRD